MVWILRRAWRIMRLNCDYYCIVYSAIQPLKAASVLNKLSPVQDWEDRRRKWRPTGGVRLQIIAQHRKNAQARVISHSASVCSSSSSCGEVCSRAAPGSVDSETARWTMQEANGKTSHKPQQRQTGSTSCCMPPAINPGHTGIQQLATTNGG